jgi:hypothetical protein
MLSVPPHWVSLVVAIHEVLSIVKYIFSEALREWISYTEWEVMMRLMFGSGRH